MSNPLSAADQLPSWQLRLLERVQSASYYHWRLMQNPPSWSRNIGVGETELFRWQTGVRAQEAELADYELHAAAVEIPDEMVGQVRAAGGRGLRWGDDEATARLPIVPETESAVRMMLVSQIVDDVWQLEHMALVRAEYLHREHTGRYRADEPALRQLHDSMSAVWRRATLTAAHAELDDVDRGQLWARDAESWRGLARLVGASTADTELRRRFQLFAWKGVEIKAEQELATLSVTGLVVGPPTPIELADSAETALNEVSVADGRGARFEQSIGSAVDATTTSAQSEWDPDPDPHPPPDLSAQTGQGQEVW
ncbi:hypothetical protein ACFWUP_23705 [Nocardia sp. NPDC058658]|uniref:hypothetical protein n=1 Tax=Nocardia sp. NPDC058658 TaxID=3346580 RepID=UPI00364E3D1B